MACWTLVDGDWELVANKSGATRLGFALLLKFFELEARFPDVVEEFPEPAVAYVAGLVKVPAAELERRRRVVDRAVRSPADKREPHTGWCGARRVLVLPNQDQ